MLQDFSTKQKHCYCC